MQTKSTPGSTLRGARVAQGLSLRSAAQLADIDPSHLSKVERDEKQLSIESLERLARVLGLRDLARLLKPYVPNRESA